MDLLGRFYTKDFVSTLLINNLKSISPGKILDLGVGNASLTIAAFNRWSDAKYYATEIELNKVEKIQNELSFIRIFNYDTLRPNLSSQLKIRFGTIDVAICNPPYIRIENRNLYLNLFKKAGCELFKNLKKVTSEIVFFTHNLSLLKKDGELGIIVSDSLITGKDYRIFREVVLNKFDLKKIIQLPDKIFNKTEARTYILILNKSKTDNIYSELYAADLLGNLSEKLKVDKKNLIERMDYSFYNYIRKDNNQYITLKDIDVDIKRGLLSHAEVKKLNINYIHSTHLKNSNKDLEFINNEKHAKYAIAKAGDILLCRVGKRCVGNLTTIKAGEVVITDCIYKITVPANYREMVYEALSSIDGIKWLKAYAHGVCSQVISKTDLENFPIFRLKK